MLLIPIALPRRNEPVSEREHAWRDELPLFLRLLRAPLQWYAPAVDSSLSPQRREVIQSQLNAAGAAYLISPAEFVILRRLALIAGIVIAATAAFVLQASRSALPCDGRGACAAVVLVSGSASARAHEAAPGAI